MNLKARLDETLAEISGKSSLADAIRYTTSRWLSMTRFTTDGRLEICNNAAERAMRPIAVGRHNWTVAGSDAGGERAALMYTLIETAKLNGLDPEAYLARSLRASPIIRAGGSQNCSPGILPRTKSTHRDRSRPRSSAWTLCLSTKARLLLYAYGNIGRRQPRS